MFVYALINDITTTYPNPPAFIEIAKQNSTRNYNYKISNLDIQKEKFSDIAPLPTELTTDELFRIVEELGRKQEQWQIISADPKTHRLEYTATTPLLRFKDDIVIEVRNDSSGALGATASCPTKNTLNTKGNKSERIAATPLPATISKVQSWVHMRSKSRTGRSDFGANSARIRNFFNQICDSLTK